jgi:hypothetical protein
MNIKKSTISTFVMMILIISIAACDATSTPATNAQVVNVTESELVTGQITQTKIFNQCDSSSFIRTEVQFSDSSAQTNQQQLMLGAEITGGGEISGAVKLEIKGSIQKHFSETQQQGQAHTESASIEVPAHTQQEYTIVWQETRRNGTVEYVENGRSKFTSYSYRVGLELISTSGKDIPCPGQNDNTPTTPSNQPPIQYSPTITDIKTRKLGTSPNQTVYADIYFLDNDGDSNRITYEVIGSAANVRKIEEDLIAVAANEQIAGTFVTVKWDCLGTGYVVTLNARVLDNKGNQSNKFPLVFDCKK